MRRLAILSMQKISRQSTRTLKLRRRVGLLLLILSAVPSRVAGDQSLQPTVRVAASAKRPQPESLPDPLPSPPEEVRGEEVATDDPRARDAWRYRFHCDRWWYNIAPGRWLFWDGQCWQDAQPTRPKIMPDGTVVRVGAARRLLAAWPQVPSYHEHHGWVGGFYSSGGGYGSSDFGYGYGIPSYGPGESAVQSRR